MQNTIRLLGSSAALLAIVGLGSVSAQADVQKGDLHYTADCGVKELRMKQGSYDVTRAGVIKGDKFCDYKFYAKKGQKVSASLVGSSDLYPILYSEASPDLSKETVTLDKTGEHTVRVLQPRNQARQGDTPKPYYLTVTIK